MDLCGVVEPARAALLVDLYGAPEHLRAKAFVAAGPKRMLTGAAPNTGSRSL